MKVYKTTSKVLGYKIGLHNDYLYVAVAEKYFNGPKMDGAVEIDCEGVKKIVTVDDKETQATFKDKYYPDKNYTLYYFKWCD